MLIKVHTDGSCHNGSIERIGGYSCIIQIDKDKDYVVLIGGESSSSSARMELMALCASMEFCEKYAEFSKRKIDLEIYTDAQYIEKSFNENWIWDWKRQGFPRTKNVDLWKRILKALSCRGITSFKITHVKGHSGIYLNEKADKWAAKAVKQLKHLIREDNSVSKFQDIQNDPRVY